MSVNYAAGLSDYPNKGLCGLPEIEDNSNELCFKISQLAKWINSSKKSLIICGAGISTVCGIPDFRGPQGVWTLEQKRKETNQEKQKIKKLKLEPKVKLESKANLEKKIEFTNQKDSLALISKEDNFEKNEHEVTSITFDKIMPSYTHFAIAKLVKLNKIKLIVSQNVDGLFLKTGLTRKHLCEVHGNFFLNECNNCLMRFVQETESKTMGLKVSDVKCPRIGRPCRGMLRDTILDWEDELPIKELNKAEKIAKSAELVICLGTSLQIYPVADLPFLNKKQKNSSNKTKVVIINLQATPKDSKADLVIHHRTDYVMKELFRELNIENDGYDSNNDFIFQSKEKIIEY